MLYQRGTTTIRDFIAPPAIKLSPNTMQIGGVLSRTYFAVAYPRFLSTIRSAHFLFEVLDPETQAPAPEGQAGELVITTLTKQALPMLRYRTRHHQDHHRPLRLRSHPSAHPAHRRAQ